MLVKFCRTKQDSRGTLGTVAILVQVGRNGLDCRYSEIERRDICAIHAHKRCDISTHTGIDMKPKVFVLCQLSEFFNRINQSIGKAWGRSNQHDGVVVDGIRHGGDVSEQIFPNPNATHLQRHHPGRFIECGMSGVGCHNISLPLKPVICDGKIACCLDCHGDGIGTT